MFIMIFVKLKYDHENDLRTFITSSTFGAFLDNEAFKSKIEFLITISLQYNILKGKVYTINKMKFL